MPDDPQRPRTVGDVISAVRVTTAVAFLGLGALAIGSLGPWVTTFLGSAAGTHGDGKITLGAAAVAALALLGGKGRAGGTVIAGVAAAVGLGVAGYDLVHIQHALVHATLFGHRIAGAGWGVYMAIIGATVAIVALAIGDSPHVIGSGISALAIAGALGAILAAAAQTQEGTRTAVSSIPSGPTIPFTTTPTATTATTAISTEPTATTTPSTTSTDATTTSALTTAAARGPLSAVQSYWQSINSRQFAGAYADLAPGSVNVSQSQFVAQERQSGITSAVFEGHLSSSGTTTATVDVDSLMTTDKQFGCRSWSGSYQLTHQGGQWLISRASIMPTSCT